MAPQAQTLAELISELRGGKSYRELAARAGGAPSQARFHQLAQPDADNKAFPDPASIRGIAEALGVDPFTVFLAAGATFGFVPPRSEAALLSRMPAGVERLPTDVVDGIIRLIRACVAAVERGEAA